VIMGEIIENLGERFGVLAESNTHQLTVVALNTDVAVGDLFLLPCRRGPDRLYIFRTNQYANVLNRSLELNEVARNKLAIPGSYLSADLADEKFLELKGILLGYAEWNPILQTWEFHKPRRLPQHLSDVYRVEYGIPRMHYILSTLMSDQLGNSGIYIGNLLAGECALDSVPVYLPVNALSHHIGIFGRTGTGKSNLMMVLLCSVLKYNYAVSKGDSVGPVASMFAIDPHDEFRTWHSASGGADGVRGLIARYSQTELSRLVDPFYYLSAKDLEYTSFERRIILSRADIIPEDLISISDFTEHQMAFANQYYAIHGENWIGKLLLGDISLNDSHGEMGTEYLPTTIAAVQRRLSFLRHGNTRIFKRFDPEAGLLYSSLLPDLICALESGRVIIVDTTLMSEIEQFLLTTIVARVLFSLRKALRSAGSSATLQSEIRQALGNDDTYGQLGMRSLADELLRRLATGALPYLSDEKIKTPDSLPYINIVIEEAPSILNPERLRFGSVFYDISRQGRKFGIGLTIVSQQISAIDQRILTQINTELTMSLGNENERKEAIRNASADLLGFEKELQVMGRGQVIISASYRDIPLTVQIPEFDNLLPF